MESSSPETELLAAVTIVLDNAWLSGTAVCLPREDFRRLLIAAQALGYCAYEEKPDTISKPFFETYIYASNYERVFASFTPEKAREFKSRCDAAIASGSDEFTFDGHNFLVSHAKYVVELLKAKGLPDIVRVSA